MCGSRYSVDDSLAPIISRPADLSRSSASEFPISCRRFSNRRANSRTVRPASVNTSSFADRSINFSPSSVSSRCNASDTAGCVRSSLSAAREKLFSATTVTKTCSGYSSISISGVFASTPVRPWSAWPDRSADSASASPHPRRRHCHSRERISLTFAFSVRARLCCSPISSFRLYSSTRPSS